MGSESAARHVDNYLQGESAECSLAVHFVSDAWWVEQCSKHPAGILVKTDLITVPFFFFGWGGGEGEGRGEERLHKT